MSFGRLRHMSVVFSAPPANRHRDPNLPARPTFKRDPRLPLIKSLPAWGRALSGAPALTSEWPTAYHATRKGVYVLGIATTISVPQCGSPRFTEYFNH